MVNTIGFVAHTVSTVNAQLCLLRSLENSHRQTYTNEHDYAPIKLYLQKQAAGSQGIVSQVLSRAPELLVSLLPL
jgi:hypothetical protein